MKQVTLILAICTLFSSAQVTADEKKRVVGLDVAITDARDAAVFSTAAILSSWGAGSYHDKELGEELAKKAKAAKLKVVRLESQAASKGRQAEIQIARKAAKESATKLLVTRLIKRGLITFSIANVGLALERVFHGGYALARPSHPVCGDPVLDPGMECAERSALGKILTSRSPVNKPMAPVPTYFDKRNITSKRYLAALEQAEREIPCDDEAGLATPGQLSQSVRECLTRQHARVSEIQWKRAHAARWKCSHRDPISGLYQSEVQPDGTVKLVEYCVAIPVPRSEQIVEVDIAK